MMKNEKNYFFEQKIVFFWATAQLYSEKKNCVAILFLYCIKKENGELKLYCNVEFVLQ